MEKRTPPRVRKMSPGEINPNNPNIIDVTAEEVENEEEIKNLSPEEREKIGWGLSQIGFKVEKAKNDFFADIFKAAIYGYEIKGHKLAGVGEKGRGKFYKELLDIFIRNSKAAVKKAEDIRSRKNKSRERQINF